MLSPEEDDRRQCLLQRGPSCSLASYYLLGGLSKAGRVYKDKIGS